MKVKISPSILGGSFSNMEKIISDLDQSNAEYIHFDVMDGDFVPNLTFGPQFISDLRSKTKKIFDVHLMINRVTNSLNDYINAGSDIITFHYEIDENLNEIISEIKKNNIKAGIAIKPGTSWEDIKKYLNVIDQVIIMTVEPGFGGQKFMNNQIEKIVKIKELVADMPIDIEVDGGINLENVRDVKGAGANVIVSGSTIFKNNNYKKIINDLRTK